MKIFFIMTNFNNSHFTTKAVESIFSSDINNPRVIIVDNASTNTSELKRLEKKYDFVDVVYSDVNVGYFAGLNLGIKFVRSELDDNTVVYVGNNDVIFPDNIYAQINSIKSDIHAYPVLSPDIRTLDGVPQNPHVTSTISKFRNFIYNVYHSNYFAAMLVTSIATATKKFTKRTDEIKGCNEAQEINQGYGAMFVLTPKYFSLFDLLPEKSFLMYEEFFLSDQLKQKEFATYYQPKISLIHSCKGATGDIPSKLKWEYSRDAHREYRKILKSYEK